MQEAGTKGIAVMEAITSIASLQSAKKYGRTVCGVTEEVVRLRKRNAMLEEQVAAGAILRKQQKDLVRRLALEVSQAEHRERTRLAELLHDGLQQLLVAAKMRVSPCRGELLSEEHAATLLETKQLIQQAIETSRTLTAELRPPILDQRGLGAAIEWLGQQTKLLFNVEVTTLLDKVAEPSNHDVRAFLYKSIRELILNAVKHAHTREVHVVSSICNKDTLRISVKNQGVGFNTVELKRKQAANQSLGLLTMEERITALGGCMWIESRGCEGTTVFIELPLERPRIVIPWSIRVESSRPIALIATQDRLQIGASDYAARVTTFAGDRDQFAIPVEA